MRNDFCNEERHVFIKSCSFTFNRWSRFWDSLEALSVPVLRLVIAAIIIFLIINADLFRNLFPLDF